MQERAYTAEARRPDNVQRRRRRLETVYRRRRIRFALGFAVACLVVAGIVIAVSAGGTTERAGDGSLPVGGARSSTAPFVSGGVECPVFARLGDRNLLLPVAAGDATIIAYRAVSDDRALELTPIGEQANSNAVIRFFRSVFSSTPVARYYLLRGTGGKPTTSVLVGALPGAAVKAPISGVVIGVKDYLLHGRYEDVQIDIRPEKSSGITVSMLFISDPVVSIGEVVTAGKTQLGKVRECPEELAKTLAAYTHDSGSHVYLQVSGEPVD